MIEFDKTVVVRFYVPHVDGKGAISLDYIVGRDNEVKVSDFFDKLTSSYDLSKLQVFLHVYDLPLSQFKCEDGVPMLIYYEPSIFIRIYGKDELL